MKENIKGLAPGLDENVLLDENQFSSILSTLKIPLPF